MRSSVAASFVITPRAPSCTAATIWSRSMAAVSRITRVGIGFSASSRIVAMPPPFGISRSSSRMSGEC
jgi:hypothetical protein